LALTNNRLANHNFFSKLRRRNVYKVAVAYAIVGWLLDPQFQKLLTEKELVGPAE
jgi:hypothetical protein